MRPAETTMLRAGAQVLGTMPDGLGQFRLAQRWWWWRRPPHRLLEQRIARGPRLELDLGDRTQALAFATRRYSPEIVAAIADRLPADGGTCFDVGANVGLITFQVTHRRPRATVHAFEPNPAAAAQWHRNHDLNPDARVRLEEAAVTAASGSVCLDAPDHDLGAGRLAEDGGLVVLATTLDDYCTDRGIDIIDVLKIDAEGSEPDVLAGARGLLAARAIGAIVLEVNEPLLAARGASAAVLVERLAADGLRPVTPAIEGDVVFERVP